MCVLFVVFCSMLIVFVAILIYFNFFIFEEAGPYRARRGAGTSIFGVVCFQKTYIFSQPKQHSFGLGNITPWSASPCRFRRTFFHQIPAYVALLRETSLFSMVYRRATASGTVPRAPGRSTCIGHTKDELRSPYDGRVVIIWMLLPYEVLAHIWNLNDARSTCAHISYDQPLQLSLHC